MIELNQITKTYFLGSQPVHALKELNLKVAPHEFISIVGKSGSGKSSLMNLVAGLDRPTTGEVHVDHKNLSALSRKALAEYRSKTIGMIFQSFNLVSHQTAFQNVELPLVFQGIPKGERQELVRKSLENVGLGHRMDHRPPQLSGGERQRVAIARALISRPPLILADEPTGNLDSKTSKEILRLLLEMYEENKSTVLFITHDIEISRSVSTCFVELNDG
ncbi:MAG: ABC transporter ATP-binding protein, partial [Simkania sp.]|nr:ABC transporter ATP-binding protein [Simkania sp.]